MELLWCELGHELVHGLDQKLSGDVDEEWMQNEALVLHILLLVQDAQLVQVVHMLVLDDEEYAPLVQELHIQLLDDDEGLHDVPPLVHAHDVFHGD